MISDARGGHVSPGVYTEEKDVTYSVNSLGLTSLGLVGETLKGPAFQNIPISDWSEFTDYFGGTSPEKYIGTGLPKYELPYVAKEYLNESNHLNVVRVLGLSGYDCGKAWVIYATFGEKKLPVAVLRSKADYKGEAAENACSTQKGNEKFREFVDSITLTDYEFSDYTNNCEVSPETKKFPKEGVVMEDENGEKNLFFTISSAETVASLGKLALKVKMIDDDNNPFGSGAEYVYNVSLDYSERDYIYKMFTTNPLTGNAPIYIESLYDYAFISEIQKSESGTTVEFSVASCEKDEEKGEDYGDYKEPFRCAMTPWIVSEIKAATKDAINMKKLFRFYTISDGNAANYQVKISIVRIRPEEGLFDVWVRDFYDSDVAPVVLEKFSNVSLVEGSKNFIGLKIGTFDGEYETKSKYVTVEVSKDEGVEDCVPCGFLGYPLPTYGCEDQISMMYNNVYDSTIKPKRQFFGLTRDLLDEDILNYKGVTNYKYEPSLAPETLTNGFHLDMLADVVKMGAIESGETKSVIDSATSVFVDSVEGFKFSSVDESPNFERIPRILNEDYMEETIYQDVNLRKFTVYPYGGFDGWDIYREQRTNGNDYKATKYPLVKGCPFVKMSDEVGTNPIADLGLPLNAITSDYYAYLAGCEQFANPEDVDINLFATPGIDFEHQSLLIEDALDIIEDFEDGRGGDALYVINAPKVADAGDAPEDIVDALEDSDIDSSYACTYWPWVKYFDNAAQMYTMLSPTKDVVRSMAYTDNHENPWFAPAGINRAKVNAKKAGMKTKLADEDELYANRINPIKTFAQDGVIVWGNKTLYSRETPLNRINVRRLMIRVKKLVTMASRSLIFEQLDNTLEKQFRSLVEPILADVQSKRGIIDWRLQVENTPETRDQHILPCRIAIKPTQSLEYVSISFTVMPEGVSFDGE